MTYYLKKCGFQELGSVGADGRPKRGRYLLTSMDEAILSFFPPLSRAQLNDSALLPVIPLYSFQKVYCNYVYHNDKFHGSTAAHPRNEYRIYLNQALEDGRFLFTTGDIIVMRKENIIDNEEEQTVYLLDVLQDHTSAEYTEMNAAIEAYPTSGGYGMYEGTVPSFEEKASQLTTVTREVPVAIDDTVTRRIVTTEEETMAALFNAATFRDFVMTGYGNLCAITGTVIRYESYMNLEAAHIKPRSHGGLYLPNNGLALCRDLHWAFDKGFFTLNDNYEVVVHPATTSDYLRSFAGHRIRIPENPFFAPSLANIHYHNDAVYGLFLTTGRL